MNPEAAVEEITGKTDNRNGCQEKIVLKNFKYPCCIQYDSIQSCRAFAVEKSHNIEKINS